MYSGLGQVQSIITSCLISLLSSRLLSPSVCPLFFHVYLLLQVHLLLQICLLPISFFLFQTLLSLTMALPELNPPADGEPKSDVRSFDVASGFSIQAVDGLRGGERH